MTDRSVAVELRLKSAQYLSGLSAVRKATRDVANDLTKATAENHRNMEKVGRAGLIAGGAIAAGIGLAVKRFAEFDKSMSGVKAVSGATASEMDKLRQAALDAGAATVFSASEAATAEAELAKAGVSVKDIMGGGVSGALDLAAAGQLDLADAATIAAQSMNIFKLKGTDVSHVADVLAVGANKSAADVGQLGDALRQGGLVAAQTGAGLEDTVGALSAFADNALIGSDAGTALKTMFQRLTPDSIKAQSAMDQIGFSAYDAQGNFVGLESVAQQLQVGLGKLTEEERAHTLGVIFGSDAVRAANVLYEEGASGIRDYTEAVNDNGAAQRMAATQLDNLAGDFEALKGSIDTALIQSGSGANDALRGLTSGATDAVNAFNGLPDPVQKSALGLAAVASGGLLTLGAFGTMLPKVRQSREALRGLGDMGEKADKGLGKLGRGAIKLGGALAILETASAVFGANADEMGRFTEEVEAAAGDDTQSKIEGLTARMDKLREFSKSGLETEIGGVRIFWDDFGKGTSDAADKADALGERIKTLKHELKLANIEQHNGGDAATVLADATEDATKAIEDYATALEDTVAIDAFTAQAELAKSFKDVGKEIKKAGAVTNAEKITLGGFATEVKSTASAIFDQTGNQAKANRAAREGREQFEKLAVQAGYTAAEARKLARRLIEIPKRTDVTVEADVTSANDKITKLARRLRRLNGTEVSVTVGAVNRAEGSGVFRAAGGIIPGPPSRSDTVPAWLSTGEFVVNSAATSANRGLLEAINSGNRFADGGFVRGGGTTTNYGSSLTLQNTIVAPDPIAAGQSVARQVSNDLWAAGML